MIKSFPGRPSGSRGSILQKSRRGPGSDRGGSTPRRRGRAVARGRTPARSLEGDDPEWTPLRHPDGAAGLATSLKNRTKENSLRDRWVTRRERDDFSIDKTRRRLDMGLQISRNKPRTKQSARSVCETTEVSPSQAYEVLERLKEAASHLTKKPGRPTSPKEKSSHEDIISLLIATRNFLMDTPGAVGGGPSRRTCQHLRDHHRVPHGNTHKSSILEAAGKRTPKRRGASSRPWSLARSKSSSRALSGSATGNSR